ncbi:hypothetical protein Q1695_005080 [Nippostrongylus brasiliensis]|nr:hypothetical protein Q1695_005080 [Nippostrongylus brasiliensis]
MSELVISTFTRSLYSVFAVLTTSALILCHKRKMNYPHAFLEGYSNEGLQPQPHPPGVNESKESKESWERKGSDEPPKMDFQTPAQKNVKAATFDPNYQTLANLNNEDIFQRKDGADPQRGAAGGAAPPPKPMCSSHRVAPEILLSELSHSVQMN